MPKATQLSEFERGEIVGLKKDWNYSHGTFRNEYLTAAIATFSATFSSDL